METLASQKGKAVETETNENIETYEELTQIENDEQGNETQLPTITIAEPVRGPFVEGETQFLKKLRKIVDEPEIDNIISWNVTKESIMIWNNKEFCNTILPTYFKHRNLPSFIRQLNYYGFRKMNRGGDTSEYTHEDFQGGQEHLAKPIKNRNKQGGCGDNSNPELDIDPSDLQEKIESLKNCTNTLNVEIMELKHQKDNIKSYLASLKRRIEDNNEHKKQQIREFLDKTFSNRIFFNQFTKLMREIGEIESGPAKKQRLEVPETSNKMGSLNGVENGENRKGDKIPVSNLMEDEGVLTEVVAEKTREREQVPNLVENEGVLSEVVTNITNEEFLVSNSVEHEGILTDVVTDETNEKEPVYNSEENEGVSTEVVNDKTNEDETVSNLAEEKVEEVVEWDMDYIMNLGVWDTIMMDELTIEHDARTKEELENLWGEHLIFGERKY